MELKICSKFGGKKKRLERMKLYLYFVDDGLLLALDLLEDLLFSLLVDISSDERRLELAEFFRLFAHALAQLFVFDVYHLFCVPSEMWIFQN